MTWGHWCNSIHVEQCVVYVNWFQLRGVINQVVWSHIWLNVKYIPTDGSQYKWYRFAWALAFYQQERLKRRNTLGCLDLYAAQNSKYAWPPISSQTPNPKGLLPVAHSIWSHHETFTLWNCLYHGAVPMAVLWIGSLPPNSFNSPNFQTSWSH